MFSVLGLSSTIIQTELCIYGWSWTDFFLYPTDVSVQLHSPPPDGSYSLVTLGIMTFCLWKFYCSSSGQITFFFSCMTNKVQEGRQLLCLPLPPLYFYDSLRSPSLSNLYCKYLVEATKENLANECKLLFFLGSQVFQI